MKNKKNLNAQNNIDEKWTRRGQPLLSSQEIINELNQLEITRAIPNCYGCGLPQTVCICDRVEALKVKTMRVHLHIVMHEKEMGRKTNTARLAAFIMEPWTHLYIWRRQAPPLELLALINNDKADVCLLYPGREDDPVFDLSRLNQGPDNEESEDVHIVIIDGTWQEAKKIFNKSPYLQALPRLEIQVDSPSQFTLRRNQKPGHLCTSEAIAEALKKVKEKEAGEKLETLTSLYLKKYEIGRSGTQT